MQTEKERSQQIYAVKALAILSVVCAHMKFELSRGENCWLSDKIIGVYGLLGVSAFFICAGYYYKRNNGATKEFWVRKVKCIIVPWILWSILTNLLSNYLKYHRITLEGQLKWTLGIGTWYYFIPVLLLLYIIFSISSNNFYILGLMLLSVFSNILTILRIWWVADYVTPYTNPLNWIIFFALGILWRRNEENISKIWNRNIKYIMFISFIILFVIELVADAELTYWNVYTILLELVGFPVLMVIADRIKKYSIVEYIGENTLFIYVVHMQIVGAINTRLPQNAIIVLVKPLLGLMAVVVLMYIITKVTRILKLDKILVWVGIRN